MRLGEIYYRLCIESCNVGAFACTGVSGIVDKRNDTNDDAGCPALMCIIHAERGRDTPFRY